MNIVLGVTGSISAYKACDIIIGLKKTDHRVRVIMTENATRFITPLTLASLSNASVMTDMWEARSDIKHIEISKWAEIFIVYPATANIIAKFANGIADDTLSTVYLALPNTVEKLICPAMNSKMYNNVATIRNLKTLIKDGGYVSKTRTTTLACGDIGEGALITPRHAINKVDTIIKRMA